MRTIIAGSRTIRDYNIVAYAIELSAMNITEVVCGGAGGVDTLGERWANIRNIPVKHFYAQWDSYGKSAGYMRNIDMAKYADACIVVWDGKSKGAKHMYNIAKESGMDTFLYTLPRVKIVI